ncbi:hypothetical protein Celaphus_00005624, partial [Cervus elaphus hippelaphus]
KSGESSSQLSQEQKSVFDEDLQKKIEENERLHIQLQLKNLHEDLSSRLEESLSIINEKLKMRDIAGQALAFVQDLVKALLNFHTYTEQRIQIFPIDSAIDTISPLNQKYLHENASYVRPLEEGMLHLFESITEDTVTVLVIFFWFTSGSTEPDGLLRTNYSSVLTNVGAALHGFHDVMKDISKHYSQKATIELELPTTTQKLITTNDCILSSVVALTNGAGKIASFFSNNVDFFIASLSYGPKTGSGFISPLSAECMLQYKKKAAAYMKALRKPLLESVPYEEALANRRVLLSSTESREGLAQQVQQSLEKISKLEQEKEHWMLEAQLAKIKLEKENQRIADKLKSTSSGQVVGVAQEKAAEVTATGQEEASAKAVPEPIHSTSECRALSKRLALAEKSKEALTEEMKVASQNISRLQDELTTTKRSYEDQLSMMSDHLCSMNETLSKQREEIDTLKMSSK